MSLAREKLSITSRGLRRLRRFQAVHCEELPRAFGVALVLAIVLGATTARADATCISAYEQTQTLRKDGKPMAAKAQAAVCAQSSCPALLTKDCTKWLAELEAITPSIVPDPRTQSGGVRADVRVKVDGVAWVIDGKPLPLEPGSHTIAFEAQGASPVERTITLKEGERGRKITVTLAPARSDARPIPLGVWVFGGASVVALATSGIFALEALGKKSDLDQCKPRCAPADVDSMSALFTMADVALGAGVMAGAAALYLFFARPTAEANSSNAVARPRPSPFASPLSGGAVIGLTTRF